MGNNKNNSKIFNLWNKGYISTESYKKYFANQNSKNLKEAIKSQYTNFKIEDKKEIVFSIFEGFKNCDDVWQDYVILCLKCILNEKCVTIKSLQDKTKYTRFILRDGINALQEVGIVDEVILMQNTKLVFLSMDYINKILNKNGKK